MSDTINSTAYLNIVAIGKPGCLKPLLDLSGPVSEHPTYGCNRWLIRPALHGSYRNPTLQVLTVDPGFFSNELSPALEKLFNNCDGILCIFETDDLATFDAFTSARKEIVRARRSTTRIPFYRVALMKNHTSMATQMELQLRLEQNSDWNKSYASTFSAELSTKVFSDLAKEITAMKDAEHRGCAIL